MLQVIDLVVDHKLWTDVFMVIAPKVGEITQLGTFCRDTTIPLTLPDNCETELPFKVVNITDEGFAGYVYLQHTHMWDYSTVIGTICIHVLGVCVCVCVCMSVLSTGVVMIGHSFLTFITHD